MSLCVRAPTLQIGSAACATQMRKINVFFGQAQEAVPKCTCGTFNESMYTHWATILLFFREMNLSFEYAWICWMTSPVELSCCLSIFLHDAESWIFQSLVEFSCSVWIFLQGAETGISQIARKSADFRRSLVWNYPLDISFRSTNPHGWPQLVLSVYGFNLFGRDYVRGYGSVRLPTQAGRYCTMTIIVLRNMFFGGRLPHTHPPMLHDTMAAI